MHIILASASPRRRELIRQIRWEGDIEPGHFPEVTNEKEALAFIQKRGLETEFSPFSRAGLVCAVNAFGKAEDAASRRGDTIPVVGADTIVVLEDRVLGKPGNREEAFSMLRSLSGKTHVVKTGMAICIEEKSISPSLPPRSDSAILKKRKSGSTSKQENPWTKPAPTASRAWAHFWWTPSPAPTTT